MQTMILKFQIISTISKKNENEVPKLLLSRGLEVNNTKTEEYVINKKSTAGKKCTFIGFLKVLM